MGVDEIEHGGFFGQDQVEGESLVAFPLMSLSRGSQPHGDFVDGFLDQLAGRACGVDGKLSTDDLDEVSTGERGLLNRGGSSRCRVASGMPSALGLYMVVPAGIEPATFRV
ncbi:hypothetical protein [Mycolicibacterium sphagni]|uniref:hypothetical protein n=1 Tax=Mycolicibacterium sphagni TaxID=1786 RepID=UPI001F342467|nr:hypothetical protein [Mycolicibacterium sphagni]